MIGTRKSINIENSELSYIEYNNSKNHTILFLHGWGGCAESFQILWQELLDNDCKSNLIALDFPSFGSSSPLLLVWALVDYAQCVVKYSGAKNLKKIDIVCHSFGGRVTTKLLSIAPEIINKVVYIAPACIKHKHTFKKIISRIIKRIFQLPVLNIIFPLIRKYGYKLIGGHDYLKVDGVLKETFKNIISEDLSPILSSIKKPVQIFWGKNDGYVPVSDAKIMLQEIKNSEATIYEDGRHGIHKTHAAKIAPKIVKFIYE